MAMRVLVYLEPVIFRDDPHLLQTHLEHFVCPMLRALSLGGELAFLGCASNIFLTLASLDTVRSLQTQPGDVRVYPLYNGDLLAPFEFSLEDYASDVFSTAATLAPHPQLLQQLTRVVEDARPDVVITTAPNRYLDHLSRQMGFTVFSMEYGPLPRLMHPGNRFVAVDGHLSQGAFASAARLRAALGAMAPSPLGPSIRDFEAGYLASIRLHPQHETVRMHLMGLRRKGTLSMLALQPDQWLTWEGALGKRRSGASIIYEALSTLRTDKLIVTFHADRRRAINPSTLREVWLSDPRMELLPDDLATGQSELFLPYVDEVLTVSSNVAMAAFLLGKPVRAIGQSFAKTLADMGTLGGPAEQAAWREKVLRYITECMSVDDTTFATPELLRHRLQQILQAHHPQPRALLQPWPADASVEAATTQRGEDLRTADLAVIHARIADHLRAGSAPAALLQHFGRHALGHLLPAGATGAEFGVARGFFSESLLQSGALSRLYSIDRWSDHHDDAEFAFVQERLAVFGDRSQILRMTFEDALAAIPDRSLDFVYVDGYAHTGHDADIARQCLPKLRPGALVAAHDYDRFSWPVNFRCLDELFSTGPFTDRWVIPAVLTANSEDIFPGVVARYVG